MKHENNKFQQSKTFTGNLRLDESSENKSDFFETYQSSISSIEIRSPIFYFIQKVEMLFIAVISSLARFTNIEKSSSIISSFNYYLSIFFASPSLFQNPILNSYLIIGGIILLVSLMIGYTIFIGHQINTNNYKINSKTIKIWIFLTHLFLPIPGYIIGYYFGYYFFELTSGKYNEIIFIIGFAALIWCWTTITCNMLYNSQPFRRKSGIFQINHNYPSFHNLILICPMFKAMMPLLIMSFCPYGDIFIYVFLASFISLFLSVYIYRKQIYNQESMNKYVSLLFIIKIPLNFIWIIEKYFPQYFDNYCVCLILFIIMSFISSFIQKNGDQSPNLINTNIPENAKEENEKIFDPTINLPFPFHSVSMTKTDIILCIFVFTCVIIMLLLNAVAAQRIPATYPLPDLIHSRFMVSKCIRTKITAISQISNDFIIFQIFLLFFLLFVFPQYFDFRRAVFIYGFICIIRSISFLLTSLPVPCAGEPNCPCADIANIKALQSGNAFKIAMSWLFGLGMFLKYPECGDLIISGHTVCIWLFTRTICDSLKLAFPRPFNWFIIGFLYTFSFFTMIYIILSKNHYSIDVWFGFIITEMFWSIYNVLLKLSMLPPKPNDSMIINIIRWVEKRPPKREVLNNRIIKEEMLGN